MNIHSDPDDIEYLAAMELHRREISDEQFEKFEGYAAEIFSAFAWTSTRRAPKIHRGDLSKHSSTRQKATMATQSCCAFLTPNATATRTAA